MYTLCGCVGMAIDTGVGYDLILVNDTANGDDKQQYAVFIAEHNPDVKQRRAAVQVELLTVDGLATDELDDHLHRYLRSVQDNVSEGRDPSSEFPIEIAYAIGGHPEKDVCSHCR